MCGVLTELLFCWRYYRSQARRPSLLRAMLSSMALLFPV
jgi:hypothetical protein